MAEADELLDVLDSQGNKTGRSLPRPEVHERELCHGTVFVWAYNRKGEVVLQLRAADKKIYPSVWDVSAAGHIDAGSTPLESAVREAKEELGVTILPKDLTQVAQLYVFEPWPGGKEHRTFSTVYIVEVELDPAQLTIQHEELTDVRLEHIDVIQAARAKPGHEKVYADRDARMYEPAFAAIRERIQGKQNA